MMYQNINRLCGMMCQNQQFRDSNVNRDSIINTRIRRAKNSAIYQQTSIIKKKTSGARVNKLFVY